MPFLTAEWRRLIMANYAVSPEILSPWLPRGTEIDLHEGVCYVSIVGFLFRDVRIKGVPIPLHRTFEEVNLRFYVRHFADGEWRRGVVFVRELVPRHAITLVANTVYRENYRTVPMTHGWYETDDHLEVSYRWKQGHWQELRVRAEKDPVPITVGSNEEFITEHYWGYARYDEQQTNEYAVTHPRWQIYPVTDYTINVDCGAVYGPEFAHLTDTTPDSVFLAEGSEIAVMEGVRVG